jgi:four helix bundle protein
VFGVWGLEFRVQRWELLLKKSFMTIRRFEDLDVWKLSRELAMEVFKEYTTSDCFSKDYKLRDQINASAGSVMDNIAEGFERNSRNEFVNFLSFSKGSVGELQSQLYRAFDRQYISNERFQILYEKAALIAKKLGSLIIYLNGTEHSGRKFKNRIPVNPKPSN